MNIRYVMEFQKCLDATEPVPYSKILSIVKEEVRTEPQRWLGFKLFSWRFPNPSTAIREHYGCTMTRALIWPMVVDAALQCTALIGYVIIVGWAHKIVTEDRVHRSRQAWLNGISQRGLGAQLVLFPGLNSRSPSPARPLTHVDIE